MAVKFNPFTAQLQLDQVGAGGGGSAFFAGEVATYADLPLDGSAPLNSRWLVRSNYGTWPFSSYKQAGIYIRTDTLGASRDNDYDLTDTSFHDVMSDDAFLIFDNTDPTKASKFDVGTNVSAGQTRTLSIPDSSGTIALTSDIPALGTGAGEAAEGNHTHGNITNDGKLGSTSGLPVVTTTAGAVTTLALGTAGQVLTVNGTADGVEFAAASGGGSSIMQSIAVGFVLN